MSIQNAKTVRSKCKVKIEVVFTRYSAEVIRIFVSNNRTITTTGSNKISLYFGHLILCNNIYNLQSLQRTNVASGLFTSYASTRNPRTLFPHIRLATKWRGIDSVSQHKRAKARTRNKKSDPFFLRDLCSSHNPSNGDFIVITHFVLLPFATCFHLALPSQPNASLCAQRTPVPSS
jgi:hypothetical protein